MPDNGYSFKQALALSIVSGAIVATPAVISAVRATQSSEAAVAAAREASRVSDNYVIRNARIAERDRINFEFSKLNAERPKGEDFTPSLMIPVSDNEGWKRYTDCMNESPPDRIDCNKKEADYILNTPPGEAGDRIK